MAPSHGLFQEQPAGQGGAHSLGWNGTKKSQILGAINKFTTEDRLYKKVGQFTITLQYYDEGAYVASRQTPQGIEVLAVGRDEANQYQKKTPPESRMNVRIGVG
jgi:hypothetical protein